METIRDLVGSIASSLKERVSNPIYGAYLLAWGVINFRLLLVLFDEGSAQRKISYIDSRLFTEAWHWLWYGFLYPVLVAVAFVFLSPFVYRWVVLFLKVRDKTTQVRLLKLADETPLSNEAASRLRRMYLDERRGRIEEAQAAAERIQELTAQVDLLSKANKQANAAGASRSPADLDESTRLLRLNPTLERLLERGDESVRNLLRVSPGDFSVIPDHIQDRLLSWTFNDVQADVLHLLRNGNVASVASMVVALKNKEEFEVRLAVDHLMSLELLTPNALKKGYEITALGRQALAALLSKGYKPKSVVVPPGKTPNAEA